MTPEELETFVARGDSRGFVNAVKNLTEAQRKKLSTTAQKLLKEINKAQSERIFDPLSRKKPFERLMSLLGRKEKVTIQEQVAVAVLAVQACAPLSQVRKTNFRQYSGENLNVEILRDRRPEWIDELIAGAISGEFSSGFGWNDYRALLADGYCSKPESEDYYRFFALGMMEANWRGKVKRKLSASLADEPDLVEDIWKLFEVETNAFAYDWYSAHEEHEGWPSAVQALCNNGLLDRDRLLNATLSGLTTGFKNNVLSNFAKLHENLAPTGDELAARQATYCDLLSANQNHVVSFAIKMLKKLDKMKKLDDANFVPAIGPVFNVSTKGPPKAIIVLLKKIAKRSPELMPQIRFSLVDALAHPAEDVQAKAVELLATCSDGVEPDVVECLQDRLEDVAASVRPSVLEIIQSAGGTVDDSAADVADVAERLDECRERMEALPEEWLDRACVPDAIKAVENSSWPRPLCFDMMQIPVLTSPDPVQPIETVEELIDTTAKAIEQTDTGIEVERVLDGISRLCDQKPDDFERRVAPLVKRLANLADTGQTHSIGVEYTGVPEVARLLSTWLTGSSKLTKPKWGRPGAEQAITRFLNVRVETLRARVADSIAAPLLAAPTHEGGWIDPLVLVDRWLKMQQSSLSPPKFELTLALLRMAPDGRSDALARATELTDDKARALRWALGGLDGPTKKDKAHIDIWIATARSRAPHDVFEELAAVGAADGEPNTIRPAVHEWKAKIREQKYGTGDHATTHRFEEIDFFTKPSAPDKVPDSRPTVLLCCHTSRRYAIFGSLWVRDWVATVWPADMQAYFSAAAKALAARLDDGSSSWEPNHVFLRALFQADRPWTEIATLTAILSVIGRDQDARGLAIDALIEAIADGRASSKSLGSVVSKLAIPQWLKLNRFSSFAEVARVSPLHAKTVLGMLEQLVVAWDELPRDAHHVLSLVQELTAQLGIPVVGSVIEKLSDIKGSSKTAKLSKAICSFNPESPLPACDEARVLILESRLGRAERWAGAK